MGKRRPQGTMSLLLYFPNMQTVMPPTRLQLLGKRHPVDIAFHGGDTGSNPVGVAIFNDLPETGRRHDDLKISLFLYMLKERHVGAAPRRRRNRAGRVRRRRPGRRS